MSLPLLGWREVLGALRKKGFYATRQTGSHIIAENGQVYGRLFQEKMS
ncbi:MAG: type II toxin-antitoxin system HicA family toxin [Candidatus Nitrosotenuis sp.]